MQGPVSAHPGPMPEAQNPVPRETMEKPSAPAAEESRSNRSLEGSTHKLEEGQSSLNMSAVRTSSQDRAPTPPSSSDHVILGSEARPIPEQREAGRSKKRSPTSVGRNGSRRPTRAAPSRNISSCAAERRREPQSFHQDQEDGNHPSFAAMEPGLMAQPVDPWVPNEINLHEIKDHQEQQDVRLSQIESALSAIIQHLEQQNAPSASQSPWTMVKQEP